MRYLALILLTLPIIIVAALNTVTRYKLKKIGKRRFVRLMVFWVFIITVVVASFPLYNTLVGNPLLKSDTLSWFDVAQTATILYMLYFIFRQGQRIENGEKILRDLHQELSIKLSSRNGKS